MEFITESVGNNMELSYKYMFMPRNILGNSLNYMCEFDLFSKIQSHTCFIEIIKSHHTCTARLRRELTRKQMVIHHPLQIMVEAMEAINVFMR